MTDQESLIEGIRRLLLLLLQDAAEVGGLPQVVDCAEESLPLVTDQILELVTQSNKALLERLRDGLPERKILPTVQEQFAHPIIRMKQAEQAEFNRALDQVTALLDKEGSDL